MKPIHGLLIAAALFTAPARGDTSASAPAAPPTVPSPKPTPPKAKAPRATAARPKAGAVKTTTSPGTIDLSKTAKDIDTAASGVTDKIRAGTKDTVKSLDNLNKK